jgi:hypothetical protein
LKNIARIYLALAVAFAAVPGCGDKQDSADKAQEAQKAIQQGMQKEKAMMEGMQKGVEDIQKKMSDQQAK